MKTKKIYIKIHRHWLFIVLFTDLFFTFIVWLVNKNALKSVIFIVMLFTLITISTGYWIDKIKSKEQVQALKDFLDVQSGQKEQYLLDVSDEIWHDSVRSLSELLKEQHNKIDMSRRKLKSYQEFIESWTHEIKTPLFLLTLILSNHKEEMSEYVCSRLQHIQYMIQEDVERILYYARLHADHMDYKFELINLPEFIDEILKEFSGIAEEKRVCIQTHMEEVSIVSDKRVLRFVLSQVLGNAFKYTKESGGIVRIRGWKEQEEKGRIHLVVSDNGRGVSEEDLPFLFDKGFTGNHPGRQNATGMGLYFVKQYAKILSVDVEVENESNHESGFGIEFVFPIIE